MVAARLIRKATPMEGYTKAVDVYGDGFELELFVRPDADLDGEFIGVDRVDGARVRVAGWIADEIVELDA